MTSKGCPLKVLCCISRNFSRLSTCHGQVAYVLLTRAPVAGGDKQAYLPAAPRLACVKPVASVHPEPGSNSSLFILFPFIAKRCCRKSPVSHSPKAAPGNLDSGFQELTKKLHLALVLLLMSIVNLSMCSFGLLRFQKRRKTLQSYEYVLNLQNFSQLFQKNFLFGSRLTNRNQSKNFNCD